MMDPAVRKTLRIEIEEEHTGKIWNQRSVRFEYEVQQDIDTEPEELPKAIVLIEELADGFSVRILPSEKENPDESK